MRMFSIGEDTIRFEGTFVIPEPFRVDNMYGKNFIESFLSLFLLLLALDSILVMWSDCRLGV